jgi:hypothetical protein
MKKIQVYICKGEVRALRNTAARAVRSVAAVVRAAIRKPVAKAQPLGFVDIWDGALKRTSIEHDTVYDEP